MKRFLAFVKKEFYHIWRDPRTLLILIGMPVVQILLFGFAITNEIRDARIAILDQSKDLHSRQIIAKIQASGYFVLTDPLSSHQQIETTFRDGKTKIVLVIGPGLASSLEQTGLGQVQLIADASDPNMANTLVNYLQAILASYTSELNASKLLPMQVDVRTRMRYNPELKGVYYFVPGLIAILLMLVSAMMTSISIAREKELGTMEVLLASPMSPVQIILAKVVPYLLLSFLDALLILGLGLWVFHVPILGNFGLLLLVMGLFLVLALALGILISTVSTTQQTALLISLMGLMLPTILLSGFIFPIENMPLPLQVISHLVPARYFIVAVKAVMLKGAGFMLIWRELMAMVVFTLVFIGSSVKKFKVRLE